MADSLVSPAVCGTMFAASTALVFYSVFQMRKNFESKEKLKLMGIAGAFVFAMQMINFAIPETGSSGHFGGAILLAALLGVCPAFLTMACVICVQAFFFADGGLLALGCNIFNMGFFGCFIAYPLVFRPISKDCSNPLRVLCASVVSTTLALQMGAIGVVLQTLPSGIAGLDFADFASAMLPVHFAIGAIEGVMTACILIIAFALCPKFFSKETQRLGVSPKFALSAFALASLFIAGGVSLFASTKPDGLEWAVSRATGGAELSATGALYENASIVQESLSFMGGYSLPSLSGEALGTSFAGIAGTLISFAFVGALGIVIVWRKEEKFSA